MRRYVMTVNGNPYEVGVEESEDSTFQVEIGGRSLVVELTGQEQRGAAPVVPQIEEAPGSSAPRNPPAPSDGLARRASAPPRPRPADGRPSVGDGGGGGDPASTMTAPMPGVIAEIAVGAGDRVAEGDTVVVLEAMKMKNALPAGRAGIVEQVLVSEGDQVKYGQALLRFQRD